jgi:hypothetical protein
MTADQKKKPKPNRTASRGVFFYLTEDEYAQIGEAAKAIGISVSGLVKRRVQGMDITIPRVPEHEARDIRYELRKLGNNMNQLAHAANSGQRVKVDQKFLKQLDGKIDEVMAWLSRN